MPIALTYRAAMQRLAELAGPEHPAHVQVKAVSTIASELSPNNPRHDEVMRALDPDHAADATQQSTWINYADPDAPHIYACYDPEYNSAEGDDEEASGPDDDDPL